MRHLLSPHRLWQLLVDGLIVAFSWWVAFQLRFNRLAYQFFLILRQFCAAL